jgi:2-polyprenyl-6-hydroxyphenyl methylase / 3-demethylubiquinone-9 3-methyltransferase
VIARPVAEVLYDRADWWQPESRAFASLRSVGAFRLDLLRQWLGADWRGRVVVDLGCGGGFLAVPLAELGARVVGVDLAPVALRAARERSALRFAPVVGDLGEPPLRDGSADVVLLSDVLEHVTAPAAAVAAAGALLRPGGHQFANTIARTTRSRWLAIRLAEGLGFVPRGTHRWELFVQPDELQAMASAAGLRRVASTGEAPRWLATLRQRAIVLRASDSMALGYAMLFVKEAA